jgi:hypothetical protein
MAGSFDGLQGVSIVVKPVDTGKPGAVSRFMAKPQNSNKSAILNCKQYETI